MVPSFGPWMGKLWPKNKIKQKASVLVSPVNLKWLLLFFFFFCVFGRRKRSEDKRKERKAAAETMPGPLA